ncbi:pentatricopeptide repeat-containing protein at1g80270 mitochondrial [Phtheirospermum japonicum]|uniref:Pentatricopeptide repeat-containing protein at1g80270 mitochondrial n=1 Tax=Phtheirospermum japonicum TaxID=374723 RepID=A0A830C1A0_9LAMI|nr:pentatricopeptide repeat-containing protein at1g80270 mitochondrial [Phtheirospermum japonicum]
MWALRRASIQLRNRGLSSGTARILCANSHIEKCYTGNHNSGIVESQNGLLNTPLYSAARLYNTSHSHSNSHYMDVRGFCSEAKSKDQYYDLDDVFSDLEIPHKTDDDDSMSESELSDIQTELETINTKSDAAGKKQSAKTMPPTSAMTKAILAAPASPVNKVLDAWVKAGNEVTQTEIALTIFHLRKRRMFFKALQVSEWLESTDHFVPVESNYASRVDLLAKVRGIFKAEEYIKQIPESLRGEIVHRTLLANCVTANNVQKSEELFNKMKKLFPITSFSCNQLLLLYKKTDKKKIGDVLTLMEKENVKPSQFTYQMLIDSKGQLRDIAGMEKIVETMNSEGVEPNTKIQLTLARHYATSKFIKKSEAILKELEGGDLVKNRWACRFLLKGYAHIGKGGEVDRVWGLCESNPRYEECLSAMEAFGLLGRIEDAESAFKKLTEQHKRPSSRHYAVMIRIYADHKMLEKGEEFYEKMSEVEGLTMGPLANDALVRLYLGAGEVEKADSILEKALQQRKGKPLSGSYVAVLDEYAKRGDVHGAERVFTRMKQLGYAGRIKPYRSLIFAYINAKMPAYGFVERMKGDNLVPNKSMNDLLAKADAFKKLSSPVAELLE